MKNSNSSCANCLQNKQCVSEKSCAHRVFFAAQNIMPIQAYSDELYSFNNFGSYLHRNTDETKKHSTQSSILNAPEILVEAEDKQKEIPFPNDSNKWQQRRSTTTQCVHKKFPPAGPIIFGFRLRNETFSYKMHTLDQETPPNRRIK